VPSGKKNLTVTEKQQGIGSGFSLNYDFEKISTNPIMKAKIIRTSKATFTAEIGFCPLILPV
jgi:hypothetical protein